MSAPLDHDEMAEIIATLIRSQNWKNGGVLLVDHSEAVVLVAQALRAAEAAGAVRGVNELGQTMSATLDRLDGKGGATQ